MSDLGSPATDCGKTAVPVRPARRRGRRRWVFAAAAAVATVVVGGVAPQPASAAQHQDGAVHVWWTMQGPQDDLWDLDQVMWVEKKAPTTYWAMQFPLTGTPDVGYMGLQTTATRPDGTVGDMALFSLWNADQARNGTCAQFDGEGTGLSCRAPFTIRANVRYRYRYRVWRLESDATGQWWGAWILDTSTGKDLHLGDIHVTATSIGTPLDFTEYWGEAVACDKVPKSVVDWASPAGNWSGSARTGYQYRSSFAGWDKLSCIAGTLKRWNGDPTSGVRVVAGSV